MNINPQLLKDASEWLGPEFQTLYKYRTFSDSYHTAWLRDPSVYFSSAEDFNDPFDCGIPWRYYSHDDETLIRNFIIMFGNHSESKGWSDTKKLQEAQRILRKLPKSIEERQKLESEQLRKKMINTGILSLTSRVDSTLMWSHYSASHTGYAIGYDGAMLLAFLRSQEPLGSSLWADKMSYSLVFPDINPYEFEVAGTSSLMGQTFLTKHENWRYESEYRIVAMDYWARITQVIDREIIKSVTFGLLTSEQDASQLIQDLNKLGPLPEFYQAVRKNGSFELEIVPRS